MLPSALSLLLSPPLLCLTPLLLLINPSPSGPAPPVSPPITCPSAPKKEGTDGKQGGPLAPRPLRAAVDGRTPPPPRYHQSRTSTTKRGDRPSRAAQDAPRCRRAVDIRDRPAGPRTTSARGSAPKRPSARPPANPPDSSLCEVVPLLEGDDVDTRGGDAFSGASGCSVGRRRPRRPRRPRRSPRGVSVRRAGGRKGPRTDRRTEARWAKAGQILHPTTAENCGRRVNKKRTEGRPPAFAHQRSSGWVASVLASATNTHSLRLLTLKKTFGGSQPPLSLRSSSARPLPPSSPAAVRARACDRRRCLSPDTSGASAPPRGAVVDR